MSNAQVSVPSSIKNFKRERLKVLLLFKKLKFNAP